LRHLFDDLAILPLLERELDLLDDGAIAKLELELLDERRKKQ